MDNFIKTYKNQFTDDLCDKLINVFEQNHKEGLTEFGDFGKGSKDEKLKNSFDLSLNPGSTKLVDVNLCAYIESCIICPIQDYVNTYMINFDGKNYNLNLEETQKYFGLLQPPKLKKYIAPSGGYHAWHQDWGVTRVQSSRYLVVMAYLNDVSEGGETGFFHQNLKIKPEKGKVVIFPPYFTHTHKGYPPLTGNKYICNCYIGVNAKSLSR